MFHTYLRVVVVIFCSQRRD